MHAASLTGPLDERLDGHPRGALGIVHSEDTKKKISEASKKSYASLNDDQKSGRVMKMLKTREKNGTLPSPRPSASWRAAWFEIGGVRKYYRSRWESNYAHYLEFQKLNGDIKSWAHEPKTFWFDGIKRGCVSYLPDFLVINNDGSEEYHEVKGWMDDRSKTKIARMARYHPGVKLIVIDSKAYKAMEKSLIGVVPGWVK